MTTNPELVREQASGAMTLVPAYGVPSAFDRIDNPLAFIETMGKAFGFAGACGCKTEAEGKLLALACLSERMNPFELGKRYHLIDGKLSMRSDAMLAEFRARGGKHKWLADGSDGQKATLQLVYDGQDVTVSYTTAEATAAGLLRKGSAWDKDRASMLRARCTSRGVRMIAPEVVVGLYTPEELEEHGGANGQHAPQLVTRTAEDIERRRQELAAAEAKAAAGAENVIDVQHEPVSQAVPESPPFVTPEPSTPTGPTADDFALTATLMAIEALLNHSLGMTKEKFDAGMKAKSAAFVGIDNLTLPAAKTLLANLENKVAAAKK
jgi:hypothetical protein